MGDFEPIEAAALELVTGGRITHGPVQIDPALIQAIGELAKAVQGVGQGLAQAKQANGQQVLGFLQQMMQGKAGGK
jgi:hypothetical protein